MKKPKIVEQCIKAPYTEQRIKVYTSPGVTEYCLQPFHCKQGFGRPDENNRSCYGDRCCSTEICKRVGNEGLRWEYI